VAQVGVDFSVARILRLDLEPFSNKAGPRVDPPLEKQRITFGLGSGMIVSHTILFDD
jgi:hypothetical protein